jgi:transposase
LAAWNPRPYPKKKLISPDAGWARWVDDQGIFVLEPRKICIDDEIEIEIVIAQDGIERNVSFLKDPLIVNDLFLKKPERIEALGMILLLCLLIWNLMQRQMRQHLDENNSSIEGLDRRKTICPTSYVMTTKFSHIILKVGQSRMLKKSLSLTRQAYIKALGLTEKIFTSGHQPP